MPDTILPNTGMTSILVGGSENTWGDKVDANFAILDNLFSATPGTGHDHSGAGKGAPIPTGGLKSLTATSTGLVTAKGDGTFLARSIAAGNGTSVTNGNGVAGNPTIDIIIHNLSLKTTTVDADEILIADSATSYSVKRVTRDKLLLGALLAGTPYAHRNFGAISGTVTLDLDQYGSFSLTPNGTVTFAIGAGVVTGKTYTGLVEMTNGGSFTINDPAGSKWPGGARPAFSPASTDVLFVYTRDGGTTNRWNAEIDSR